MTSRELGRELADLFVSLADSLRPDFDAIEALTTLVYAAADYTRAVGAGILLADPDGVLHVVASSSEDASHVEAVQLAASEGPCIDSFHSGRQTESPHLAQDEAKWPDFSRAALGNGYQAVHAFPLCLRDDAIGAMNLFSAEPGPLSDVEVGIVQALTGVVTVSILQKEARDSHVAVAEQLQRALDDRVIIEQAKGILMGRLKVSGQDAFDLMRARARNSRQRVSHVAARIVSDHATG